MIKQKFLHISLSIAIIFSMLSIVLVNPVQASTFTIDAVTEEEVKSLIQSYFELRYLSLSNLKVSDFSHLISTSPEADSFWQEESDKLEAQIKHANIKTLRYLEYEFFLEFKDILVDNNNKIYS